MPNFDSFDGLSLYYDDRGDGRAVVLLHGFAADTNLNFVRSGILDMLVEAGYRTIALDTRGHGLSSRPTEREAYENDAIRRDVEALLDHLDINDCIVVGYSMGGQTALRFAATNARVKALVLLGVGEGNGRTDDQIDQRNQLIKALRADDPDDIELRSLRQFRIMAGLDREPLVALLSAEWADTLGPARKIDVPVLLIIGHDDERAISPDGLLAELKDASAVRVPGNHFTANAHPDLHRALLEFLASH